MPGEAESQRDSSRKAQGCEERATLGKMWQGNNPNGVAALWGKPATTPSGLKSVRQPTQGSSFLATLGWLTQSRWDCKTTELPGFARFFL